jgi:hypothetical protein
LLQPVRFSPLALPQVAVRQQVPGLFWPLVRVSPLVQLSFS